MITVKTLGSDYGSPKHFPFIITNLLSSPIDFRSSWPIFLSELDLWQTNPGEATNYNKEKECNLCTYKELWQEENSNLIGPDHQLRPILLQRSPGSLRQVGTERQRVNIHSDSLIDMLKNNLIGITENVADYIN